MVDGESSWSGSGLNHNFEVLVVSGFCRGRGKPFVAKNDFHSCQDFQPSEGKFSVVTFLLSTGKRRANRFLMNFTYE